MKVLWVLNELRPSGAEVTARIAGTVWPRHGVQVEILSLGVGVGTYAQDLRNAGYRIHHIPLQPFGRWLKAYLRLLRDERYDVVHVHPERGNVYVAGVAVFSSASVIRTVHNVFAFQGVLRLQRRAQRAALRFLGVRHVSVGTSVAKSELRYFGNPSIRIFNWYDDTRFNPWDEAKRVQARAAFGVAPEEFLVVTVGNCSSVKNHEAVIRALRSLPSSLAWRYVHAGIEDASGWERAHVRELGLEEKVEFVGAIEDVPALLNAADCYVMPSLHEGFSIAALEALSCGVPCVLADVDGLRDLSEFFPDISWVAPEAETVAAAILHVFRISPEERRDIRHRMALTASQQFSAELGVARYVDFYRLVRESE